MRFDIQPSILVILGATGDLTRRKLMPALFDLYRKGVLPRRMKMVGFSRRELTDEEFREKVRGDQGNQGNWGEFSKLLSYVRGDFTRIDGYRELNKVLGRQDNQWKFCANKLFYLAVPPRYYDVISDNLHESGLTQPCSPEEGWTRIILEKPFGKDLESARKLDEKLGRMFREEQIFRIDHFLGKESMQNILAFRFANPIFEPLWNKDYIDHIQIIAAETLGMEGRGAFYDDVGALRDMIQSHLLQMVAAVAMERPVSFAAEKIRDERVRVLQALSTPGDLRNSTSGDSLRETPDVLTPGVLGTVRGQYKGYREEKGVAKDSQTETLAAVKLFIDNQRWRGVPFYLLTGKRMKKDITQIVVQFKQGTDTLFAHSQEFADIRSNLLTNKIIFQMKPDECITVEMLMKEPGLTMEIAPHPLKLDYGKVHNHQLLDAYGKLLIDCMTGDQTLFARTDGIRASWRFIGEIREAWGVESDSISQQEATSDVASVNNILRRGEAELDSGDLEIYRDRSWGPRGARKLIERDGRRWYLE